MSSNWISLFSQGWGFLNCRHLLSMRRGKIYHLTHCHIWEVQIRPYMGNKRLYEKMHSKVLMVKNLSGWKGAVHNRHLLVN